MSDDTDKATVWSNWATSTLSLRPVDESLKELREIVPQEAKVFARVPRPIVSREVLQKLRTDPVARGVFFAAHGLQDPGDDL